jgi:hypothetical protein
VGRPCTTAEHDTKYIPLPGQVCKHELLHAVFVFGSRVCTGAHGLRTWSLGVVVSPLFLRFLCSFRLSLSCVSSRLLCDTACAPPRADLPLPFSTIALRFRSYALQHAGVRVIWDVGNDVFKKQLEQLPDVLLRITSGLLGSVESYRYRLLDLKGIAWRSQCIGSVVTLVATGRGKLPTAKCSVGCAACSPLWTGTDP